MDWKFLFKPNERNMFLLIIFVISFFLIPNPLRDIEFQGKINWYSNDIATSSCANLKSSVELYNKCFESTVKTYTNIFFYSYIVILVIIFYVIISIITKLKIKNE